MKIPEPKCVQWKREGQARIREQTEHLSRDELIAWWEERNREFSASMAELKAKRRSGQPSAVGD